MLSGAASAIAAAAAVSCAAALAAAAIVPARPAALRASREAPLAARFVAHRGRGGGVVETLRFLPHDAAADEALESAQFGLVLGRDKTDGVPHGVRAPHGLAVASVSSELNQ